MTIVSKNLLSASEKLTRNSPVIYLDSSSLGGTARGFQVHAVDYLLKPIVGSRLDEALRNVRERIEMEDALARKQHKWFEALHRDKSVTKVVQSEPRITRIAVKNGRHYLILQTNEIDWIASAGNYLEIHALGSTYLRRGTMHAFEERLGLDRFIRIHRTHLVNLDRIREIVPIESGDYEVILRNGTPLRMSRVYKQRLFSHLDL